MGLRPDERGGAIVTALAVVGGVAVLGLARVWLADSDLPDGYQNEFIHLYMLTEMYYRIGEGDWSGAFRVMSAEYYPPLLHSAPSLAMSVLGRSREVATLAAGAMVIPLLAGGGALARRLGGTWAGVLAVVLLAGSPSVFGNVRRYEPNITVAAAVACALALLAGPPSRRRAVGLGLVVAFGMLADRLSFALFLGLPMLASACWPGPDRAARRRACGWSAGVAVLGCGWYYVHFFTAHFVEIWTQLGGEITSAGVEDEAPRHPIVSLFYYALTLIDCQSGVLPGTAMLLGVVAFAVRGRHGVPAIPQVIAATALVAPALVLTMLGKKQPFYSIPWLAPLAAVGAAGVASVLGERMRRIVLPALAAVSLLQAITQTRGAPPAFQRAPWSWLAGASPLPAALLGPTFPQAGPPVATGLDLARAAPHCTGENPGAVMFSDAHQAYEGQAMPTLRLLLDTREVYGLMMEPEAFAERAATSNCFVYVSGDEARDWPTPTSIDETITPFGYDPLSDRQVAALAGLRSRMTVRDAWPVRDGGRILVYTPDAPR